MSDLKPCPFCGNDTVYLRLVMQEADVFCQKCETNGPVCDSDTEAIAAWNTRADLVLTDPRVVALVKALKEAYEEGFVDGASDGWTNNPRIEKEWRGSRARAALKAYRGETK